MIKLAKITDIDSRRVVLKLEENVKCTDCKSRCSNGFLSFLFHKKNKGLLFVALNSSEVLNSHLKDDQQFFQTTHKKNDIVGLNFNENDLFKMSLILYGLPIIIFIMMLFIGYYTFDLFQFNADFGGVLGLILGLYLSKVMIKHFKINCKPEVKFFK
ncbi:MAG: SoxR reducing system RseC family protein [Marinicellaceae bacterium]